MNDENLIPKDISKKPNHRELSIKGGKAKSKAKTLANQIKGYKIAKPENQEELIHKIITDPEFSLKHIAQLVKNLPPDRHSADLWLKTHKAAHGEKKELIIQGNLNLGADIKSFLVEDEWGKKPSLPSSNILPIQDKSTSTNLPPDSESSAADEDGAKAFQPPMKPSTDS